MMKCYQRTLAASQFMGGIQHPLKTITLTALGLLISFGIWEVYWGGNDRLMYRLPAPPDGTMFYEGKIRWYFSPDTFEIIDRQGATHMVRLAGADCPEPTQSLSSEVTRFVRDRVLDKMLSIQVEYRDQRKVEFARITVDQTVLSKSLLEKGLAWYVPAEFSNSNELRGMEQSAREARRGIWEEVHPTPPWEVRGNRWDDDEIQVRKILLGR